ncbi:MAG: hypothetical protein GX625_05345 [Clostridiaceae bacterium]|nr:hypothetical protein [Clostridiaceae bacterium]
MLKKTIMLTGLSLGIVFPALPASNCPPIFMQNINWIQTGEFEYLSDDLAPFVQVKNAVQTVLRKVPGLSTIRLNAVLGQCSKYERDCCTEVGYGDDQYTIELVGGRRKSEGTGTISVGIKGKYIWGGEIDRKFNFGFAEIDITAGLGLYVGSDLSLSATAGKEWNVTSNGRSCKEDDCLFATLASEISLSLGPQLELIVCADTLWTRKNCYGVVGTANVETSFGGSVSFGCGNDTSNLSLDILKANASFTVAGVTKGITYDLIKRKWY